MTVPDFIREYQTDAFAQTPETLALLADPLFRDRLLRTLHTTADPSHRPLLLALFAQELEWRSSETDDDDALSGADTFENVYWCALLLHKLGDVRDSLVLWNAKASNMDIGAGMDVQFLVGAGVQPTIDYLNSLSNNPAARNAADDLDSARRDGDFDDLPGWLAFRTHYFAPPTTT